MIPSELPNFVNLLKKRALNHPERDCVIFLEDGDEKEVPMSYYENDKSACIVAANLQKMKKHLYI